MFREMMVFRKLLTYLFLVLLSSGWVSADDLTEGAEILVTDPSGEIVLGHGVVQGGRLNLNLSSDAREFVMLVSDNEGRSQNYSGSVGVDGRISVTDHDGQVLGLDELAAKSNVAVQLTSVAGSAGTAPAVGEAGVPGAVPGTTAAETAAEGVSGETPEAGGPDTGVLGVVGAAAE